MIAARRSSAVPLKTLRNCSPGSSSFRRRGWTNPGGNCGKYFAEDVGRLHADGVERLQPRFELRVFGDSLGVQLEFDPLLDAQLADCFEITGARAEGQAVERLQDLLFG